MKPMRDFLGSALQDTSSPAFRRLTTILAGITLISVFATVVETVPLFTQYKTMFIFIEWLTVVLFTLEYGARAWIAPHPRAYLLSSLGLLDLASILPTYLGMGSLTFLKSVRIVRTMRFVRIVGRTNISHVQKKGEIISEKLDLSQRSVSSLLIAGAVTCTLLYHAILMGSSISYVVTIKTFLGFAPVPATLRLGGALLIILGKVLGALFLGLLIGYAIEYMRTHSAK